MKTTIELPDPLFRKVKATAADRGLLMKDFFIEALRDKLAKTTAGSAAREPVWMAGFGSLRTLRRETRRIQAEIDQDLRTVGPEDHE